MAFHKKYFIVAIVIAYATLIGVFFATKPHCSLETPCLRFCCSNETECANSFITSYYDDGSITPDNVDERFVIKSSEPGCSDPKEVSSTEWKLSSVRNSSP